MGQTDGQTHTHHMTGRARLQSHEKNYTYLLRSLGLDLSEYYKAL